MIVHLKPGQKVKDLGTDEHGVRHMEVIDKATGEVVERLHANYDIDVVDVREPKEDRTPPENHRRVIGDPRQNPRV